MVRLIGWFNPLVGEVYEMLLPKRLALSLRFFQVRESLQFLRHALRRRNSHHRSLFSESSRVGSEVEKVCWPYPTIGPLYWRIVGKNGTNRQVPGNASA
jgi:hypothetical protein